MGGNFNPDGSAMDVTFDGLIADILSSSASSLNVEVPIGALSGDVQVCWAGICSNSLFFKIIVGPEFEDISSIAFEAGTGSLWIADRGTTDTIFELEPDGTLTARGVLNQAVLAHPSPSDGSGRIYYCNGTVSQTNSGRIEYIDSATNGKGFLDNAGSGTVDPVHCVALAANDLEPEFAYFFDGEGDSIRRVGSLVSDFMYGDQNFSFNSPAGGRFDSVGNLYLSTMTTIYRILPMEAGVEMVADGFTGAAGIDLTEASGLAILLVADQATGEVWLVNGETGEKNLVQAGFDGPVAVAFTEDPSTGDLYYDVAEPTRVLRLPDPSVVFVVDKASRVLLSKVGTDDDFPAPEQTEDGKIEVQVKVIDAIDPAGTTVYFRLIDPKDPSSYLSGQSGDNLPTTPGGSITSSAVAGTDGLATATLTVDPNNGGNNYLVEVSFEAPPNFKKRGRSKEYTTWRRLYVEHDRMYKAGEFTTQIVGAGEPNPERVFVNNPGFFSPGDQVHLFSGDSIAHAAGEFGTVSSVGASFVDLASPLQLTYSEPQPGLFPFPYGFLARTADGVFDAEPLLTDWQSVFDHTFTEWVLLPLVGYVPYWQWAVGATEPDQEEFIDTRSPLFFASLDSSGVPRRNHVQLVSASRFEQAGNLVLGRASADNVDRDIASNWSWIFLDTIEQVAPGNAVKVRNQVTAHELGHQLNVNGGKPGHDTENAWGSPGSACLMNMGTPPNTPSTPRFHVGPSATQDLLCIRTHIDDLNENSCPNFPEGPP